MNCRFRISARCQKSAFRKWRPDVPSPDHGRRPPLRKIDLHAYPGTQEWITCQGPYVQPLAAYWKREWKAKDETDVIAEFETAGVETCLVALDLSATIGTPPCSNDYVAGMRDRHPCVIQAWAAVEPAKGASAIVEARHAVRDL